MLNLNKEDEKKVICGTVIGGILAVGLTILYATRKGKKHSTLSGLGSTISSIVESLEDCKEEAHDAVHKMEDKIKENEGVLCDIFELASVGMSLWKKMHKGK